MKILRAISLFLPLTWTITVQADDTKTTPKTPETTEVMVLNAIPEIGDTLTEEDFDVLEIQGDGSAGDFNALEHQMGYEIQTVTMPTTKVWQPEEADDKPKPEDGMVITLHTTRIHNISANGLKQDDVIGVIVLTDMSDKVLAVKDLVVGGAITQDDVMTWAPDVSDGFKPGQKYEVKLSVFRTDKTHTGFNLSTPTTVFSDDHKTYTSFETHAYTADEFVFEKLDATHSLTHKAVTETVKSYKDESVTETTEEMTVSFPKLQTTKTGYGIPVNVDVTFAGNLPDLKMTRHKDLLVDYNTDYDQTQEVMDKNSLITGETHFQMPKTYVQRDLLGTLWSANQVTRPADTVDGGNKLYVPVWFDFETQNSDVIIESTQPIGVNQWTIKLTQAVEVNAFMYVSIGSPTLLQDELLIQPIFTHSFYEQYKDKNWFVDPVADTAWIMSDDF